MPDNKIKTKVFDQFYQQIFHTNSSRKRDTEKDEPNNNNKKETYPANFQRQSNLGDGQHSGSTTNYNVGNNEINQNKEIDMRDDYEKDEDGKK